jgi:hypothetical protein
MELARARIPDSQELEDMRSDPSSLYLVAAIAFFAGIAVGWLLATVRVKGRIQVSLAPPGTGTPARLNITTKTRKMEIKCGCGSLMKFRDPVEPGYQPYPTGGSVTCPDCGRTKDLTEIRKLERDVQA